MNAYQIIIVAPINPRAVARLKDMGYQTYAYCNGIRELVEIRNISPTQVEIGHWGYKWIPLKNVMKVIASKLEPDRRSTDSKVITQTFAPNLPSVRRSSRR